MKLTWPANVIRLRPGLYSKNYGHRWHFVSPINKRRTVCGLLIYNGNLFAWEASRLSAVRGKAMCARCLGPLTATDQKKGQKDQGRLF